VATDRRRHPIQAVEIRVDSVVAKRRQRRKTEAEADADAYASSVRLVDFSEDHRAFGVAVKVGVVVPLVDDQVWAASIDLVARFTSEVVLKRSDALAFAQMSGLFLVWPYARTHLTELARMAGVSAPLLPLLTRPTA
jgi:hypothetical protein